MDAWGQSSSILVIQEGLVARLKYGQVIRIAAKTQGFRDACWAGN